jgi:hypothetical protein
MSTKIARLSPDHETVLRDLPLAYLLDDREANNDPTNYWIFSEAGLRRLIKRTGWEPRDFITVGNTVDSDPAGPDGDERAFCLLERVGGTKARPSQSASVTGFGVSSTTR